MKDNLEILTYPEKDSLNLKNEISYYLFFWPWFLLTLILATTAAYIYLRYTPNIYSSSAQVQITKSDASSSFLTSEVTSLFGTRVYVQNDISVMTSNHILSQVVQQLDLQTSITEIGRVKSSLLFADEVPFEILFKDANKFQQWELTFLDELISISDGVVNYELNKNEFLDNENFSLRIIDSSIKFNKTYKIINTNIDNATSSLKKRLVAKAPSDRGEIIDITISGTNKKRNDAVLNTLIKVITEDRIADQRQLSQASIKFIDKRLKLLKKNLDSISKKTISYQIENDIYDADVQTSNALNDIVKENEAAFNLKIQLEISTSLLNQLKSQENFEILPANIGIADSGVNNLLVSYNTLVMERNTLLISATNNSPLILQINNKLKRLRKANLEGISRYIENLQVSLSSYQKINDKTLGIVAEFPEKGYMMRTMAREFKFAEDLLVFLSQRKEEASIS